MELLQVSLIFPALLGWILNLDALDFRDVQRAQNYGGFKPVFGSAGQLGHVTYFGFKPKN